MEKRVLLTELVDRGSHLRKEITPTAVVTDDGKYTAGTFWDANKTLNEIVHGATEAQDTLKEVEDKLNNEIATARNAEQALSDRMDDILGIDALDIADLKGIVEDLDPETGILSVIDNKVDKKDFEDLKEDISIELSTVVEDANGHDYVEIAGIKWATKNVGAQNATDTGLYFAWGETTGYTAEQVGVDKNFTSDDYELPAQTKYNWDDNKAVLELTDDAAAINMGGSWRMPTVLEWQTLLSAINFIDYNGNVIVGNNKHTTLDGVTGIYIADKTDNLKRLFFPISGFASGGSIWYGGLYDREYSCNYWTSTVDSMYDNAFDFYSDQYIVSAGGESYSRNFGLVIRGVLGSSTVQQSVLGTTITDDERTKWNTVDNKANTADLGTAATKNVPTTGNASTTEVVMGNDSRLTDARTPVAHTHTTSDITDFPSSLPASDVSAWAKAANKPTYAYSEITGTPTLSTVATSGSYNDLNNTPDLSTKANIDDISVEIVAGHEYVEIAGIKWATMNIGANSVTDRGLYFQWGDTQGYTAAQCGSGERWKYFGWADYKWTEDGGLTSTKYNSSDGKAVIDASDDAVQANWGGQWRMPTTEEYLALGNAVNTAWTDDYQGSGVEGLVCTDKTDSSKVLFFPACGRCNDGIFDSVGSLGLYWSSSLFRGDVQCAFVLCLYEEGVKWRDYYNRYVGFPVRGVYTGDKPSGTGDKVLGTTILDSERTAWNAKSNFSGSYDDLTNKPNVVTSTTTGLKIEVVASMPASPDANTIYIVQ